jgi:acylphosphatase
MTNEPESESTSVSESVRRARVVVHGDVQGVFFRKGCAEAARARGLAGFVRNLPDGTVEAAFEGPPDAVQSMIAWCHGGTDWADVESVEVTDEQPKGDTGFSVEH